MNTTIRCMNQHCWNEQAAQLGVALLGVVCPVCGSAMGIVKADPLSLSWAETLSIGLVIFILWKELGPSKNKRRRA